MPNTRSPREATSYVAHPTNRSSQQSHRPKRRMSSESTETSTNSKPMKNKARSAHWPVSFANQVSEVEDDEVLKAEGYENEELNDKHNEEDEEDEDEHEEEDNHEVEDEDEVLNALDTRIHTKQQRRAITQADSPSPSDDDLEIENLPSIQEYKDLLDEWPPTRIAVVARSQKKKGTAVPPHILTEARAIRKLYKQQKAMLSIMGNISKFTLDKAL